MKEPRWADDIPPPHATLYTLGQRCLDLVNRAAKEHPQRTPLEHELLEIGRTHALALSTLSMELLRLRQENVETVALPLPNSLTGDAVSVSSSAHENFDSLLTEAKDLVRISRNGSTSRLQRKLSITYAVAEHLMDEMERAGLVTAADQLGRRSVVATLD